ncbi:MAG: hypothetical protein NTW61_02080 [Candidatus Melainabacteria bacterium]|jgi:hypothetical protein|nr:hypothetical protein [Candidatus Melainabacteria bacterium]
MNTLCFDTLDSLITEGLAITKTKKRPTSRIIADWQSTETLYSVVDAEPFHQWRASVLSFLKATFGEDSDPYWTFQDECRFPQFMELLEGIKVLKFIKQQELA